MATRTKIRQWLLLAAARARHRRRAAHPRQAVHRGGERRPAGDAVGGPQSAVIVIDDSMLDVGRDGAASRSSRRRARGRGASSRRSGADSDVAIVLASKGGGAPVPQLTADRAQARARDHRRRGRLIAKPTSPARSSARRRSSTARRAPERRVYLVVGSGGARLQPPSRRGPPGTRPRARAGRSSPTAGRVANRAIVGVAHRAGAAPRAARRARLASRSPTSATQPLKELPVTLRVDGKAVARGSSTCPAHGRAQKRFSTSYAAGERRATRRARGRRRARADALAADDRRFAPRRGAPRRPRPARRRRSAHRAPRRRALLSRDRAATRATATTRSSRSPPSTADELAAPPARRLRRRLPRAT